MPHDPEAPRPTILLTSGTVPRERGLRRNDTIQGHNYSLALTRAGGTPLLAPNVDPQLADAYADLADGLLLTGGVDLDPHLYGQRPRPELGTVDRNRDAFELALYRAFRERGKPVLGICRGPQLVNIAHGGSLHQHLPAVPGAEQHMQRDVTGAPLQRVALEPGSRLAAAFGTTELSINSFHHQAVDRIGDGLRATARAGDGLVEALELDDAGVDGFVVAVQWHPEMCWDTYPEHHTPFRMVVEACKARRQDGDGLAGRTTSSATVGSGSRP